MINLMPMLYIISRIFYLLPDIDYGGPNLGSQAVLAIFDNTVLDSIFESCHRTAARLDYIFSTALMFM